MQHGHENESVLPTIKQEKPSNKQFPKIPRLCSSGSNSIQNFISTYLHVNLHLLSSIHFTRQEHLLFETLSSFPACYQM